MAESIVLWRGWLRPPDAPSFAPICRPGRGRGWVTGPQATNGTRAAPRGDQTQSHSGGGDICTHRSPPSDFGQDGDRARMALWSSEQPDFICGALPSGPKDAGGLRIPRRSRETWAETRKGRRPPAGLFAFHILYFGLAVGALIGLATAMAEALFKPRTGGDCYNSLDSGLQTGSHPLPSRGLPPQAW